MVGPKKPTSNVCWCPTMAYVGTKRLFERAGFTQTAETTSVLNGFPRVLMRLDLRQ